MRLQYPTLNLVLFIGGLSLSPLLAGDPAAVKNPAVVIPEAASRWSVSAGATVRSIDAEFSNHLRPLNTDGILPRQHTRGRGDVGLYHGGLGTIHYNDGQIGPEGFLVDPTFNDDGTANSVVHSSSQVSGPTGRTDFGDPIVEVSFHSSLTTYAYDTTFERASTVSSDTDVGVGPYVQLAYALTDANAPTLVNLVTGYSWVNTDHATGNRQLASQWVTETRTRQQFTYVYDYSTFSGITAGPFPFVDNASWAVFDSAKFDAFYNSFLPGTILTDTLPPRKRVATSRSSRIFAQFFAVGSADLDVDLHEIPLGIEVGRQFGKLELFLTAGATINVIDYDLTSRVNWYQSGRTSPVASGHWSDNSSEVKLGFYGGVEAHLPLTEDGRLYVEAHGSYRWVDPTDANAGFASVTIDPSSWEGGVGIGFRF